MDNITHSLTGVVMARAGLARRCGRGTTLLMVVASNLPDVDTVALLAGGADAHLLRRTLTHSVFGVPVLCLVLAALFKWRRRDARFATLFALALLGAGVHVFMDLVNSYGVVLFFPASSARFELAWTFIVDLAVWAILVLPLLVAAAFRLARRSAGELPFRIAAGALALYFAACAAGHARSETLLARAAAEAQPTPGAPWLFLPRSGIEFSHVFPEALGPHRFRGVVRRWRTYDVFLIHPWTGRAEHVRSVQTDAFEPDVFRVRQRPEVRRLEAFFKAPVWTRHPERGEAEVYDLRFRSEVVDRGTPFAYTFPLPP